LALKRASSACFPAGSSIVYTKRLRKAIKILIAVVIGALLLGGLYALFGDTILPTLRTKIAELFNYEG